MASSTPSTDRDLPPLPVPEPATKVEPSTQSLHSVISTRSNRNSDVHGSSISRERSRSSRDTKTSFHTEIERGFQKLNGQVQQERRRAEISERRAEDAERKLLELTAHLKVINDARLDALREAGRANEELKLYRIQLDHAQREIYRAQDVIGMVDKQRLNAEKDAAKSRSKARELNEKVLMQAAKNEAYQIGLQEGLSRGRELAFAGQFALPTPGVEGGNGEYALEERDNYSIDDSPFPSPQNQDHTYLTGPRSIAASGHSRAPSIRSRAPSMQHSRPPSVLPDASPSPVPIPLPSNPPTAPPTRPSSWHPSENIRPISIRNGSHTPRMNNTVVPPDNLIPSLDADNRIRIPPPFEFQRIATPERPPSRPLSPQLPVYSDSSQEPLPIPPRAYTPHQRKKGHHKRNSSSESNSSQSISQLEIINNTTPFFASLRTPMSIIQEVNSAHSGSPLPQSEDGDPRDRSIRHQRSISDNSVYRSQAPSINVPADRQSQHGPRSRSSYAGSLVEPTAQEQQHNSNVSSFTTLPNISVEGPSTQGDSIRGGGSRGSGSPGSQRASSLHQTQDRQYPTSLGMPGGYINTHPSAIPTTDPPVIPTFSRRDRRSSRQSGYNAEDDAVSSTLSGDTLTTPPDQQRSMEPEIDWSRSAAVVLARNVFPLGRHAGPSNTAELEPVWHIPEAAIGVTMQRRS